MTSLQILLATYNGAAYLAEQLESIQRQTHKDWRLLIRDDQSTDATHEIIRSFMAADARIDLSTDPCHRLGVLGNFAALANTALRSPARYFAFADQDDVWHPQKLAWQLAAIRSAEARESSEMPIAVHSDLQVVDAHLRQIHPSFLRYQGLRHESDHPLRTLIVQNFVTGCTMLFNRPLLELAAPLPPEALVHDWWVAQCAAAAGRLEFVPQATVRYRQHGGNTIGARRWWRPRVGPKLRQLATRGQSLIDAIRQVEVLQERLEMSTARNVPNSAFLDAFLATFRHRSPATRIVSQRNLGVRRQGRWRNAVLAAQTAMVFIEESPSPKLLCGPKKLLVRQRVE